MNTLFTVINSTVTTKGNFCTKVQRKSVGEATPTPFGQMSGSQKSETYYLFLEQKAPVGMQAPLDIEAFDVRIKEYQAEGKVMELKYLYPKAS